MRTLAYVGRRVLFLVPQMLLISAVTFVLIRMLPGDPARLELGPLASEEGVQALRERLRLDESIIEQYGAYLGRMLHGDFGKSWVNGSDVGADMVARIPATLELIGFGLVLVLLVLVPVGIATSVSGGGWITRALKKITYGYGMLAGALPDFWLGLLLLFIFSATLGWLPGPEGRLGIGETAPPTLTGFYTIDALARADWRTFLSALRRLLLPGVTLAFVYGAPIYKMVRSSMAGALRANYTTYARAVGLRDARVLWYAFRNAAPPAIVIAGVITGFLLGGAVLIEAVFNINGIGRYAIDAIATSDYAPIQAFVLFAAIFTMLVYLLVDLLYFMMDPRADLRGRVR